MQCVCCYGGFSWPLGTEKQLALTQVHRGVRGKAVHTHEEGRGRGIEDRRTGAVGAAWGPRFSVCTVCILASFSQTSFPHPGGRMAPGGLPASAWLMSSPPGESSPLPPSRGGVSAKGCDSVTRDTRPGPRTWGSVWPPVAGPSERVTTHTRTPLFHGLSG